jgi:hypothetical protein
VVSLSLLKANRRPAGVGGEPRQCQGLVASPPPAHELAGRGCVAAHPTCHEQLRHEFQRCHCSGHGVHRAVHCHAAPGGPFQAQGPHRHLHHTSPQASIREVALQPPRRASICSDAAHMVEACGQGAAKPGGAGGHPGGVGWGQGVAGIAAGYLGPLPGVLGGRRGDKETWGLQGGWVDGCG